MRTKCVNYTECKNVHPTGIRLLADGWGLQGIKGKGFKAICPECLVKQRSSVAASENHSFSMFS